MCLKNRTLKINNMPLTIKNVLEKLDSFNNALKEKISTGKNPTIIFPDFEQLIKEYYK